MAKSKQGKDGKPVNKSEAIRDMIALHPQAQSKEIVSLLGERGIKVQPSLVYYIKSKQNQQRRRQKRQRVAETSQGTGAGNPVDSRVVVSGLTGFDGLLVTFWLKNTPVGL